MPSITHCPHCNTIFRVTDEQLQLSSGMVRCGICHRIFNGIDQQLDASDAIEASSSTNIMERNVFPEADSITNTVSYQDKEENRAEINEPSPETKNAVVQEKISPLTKGRINSFTVSLNVEPGFTNKISTSKVEEPALEKELPSIDSEDELTEEQKNLHSKAEIVISEKEEPSDLTTEEPLPAGAVITSEDVDEPSHTQQENLVSEAEEPPQEEASRDLEGEAFTSLEETTLPSETEEFVLGDESPPCEMSDTAPEKEPAITEDALETGESDKDTLSPDSSFVDPSTTDFFKTDSFVPPSDAAILAALTEELSSISLDLNKPLSDSHSSSDLSLNQPDSSHVALEKTPSISDETVAPINKQAEAVPPHKVLETRPVFPISEEIPDFVKLAKKRQRSGRTLGMLMGLICLLLLLLFSAQGIYTFSDRIITWWPPAEPLINQACEIMSCPNRQQARIAALSIESSELRVISGTPGTYNLDLIIRNNSSSVQSWPYMELTLMDAQKKTVVRRVFTPENYLTDIQSVKTGFTPHSEQTIKLYFEFQQDAAVDYRVYLFYP